MRSSICGPVLRVGAARAGVHFADRVALVVLAAEQRAELELVEVAPQRARRRRRSPARPSRRLLRAPSSYSVSRSDDATVELVDRARRLRARATSPTSPAARGRRRPTDRARSPAPRARRAARAPRRCAGTRARRRHDARDDQRGPRRNRACAVSARGRACTSCRCRRSTARCGPASSRPAPAAAATWLGRHRHRRLVGPSIERRSAAVSSGSAAIAASIAPAPCTGSVGRAVRDVAHVRARLLVDDDLEVEHVADEVVLDLAHHRLEHVEALALPLRRAGPAGPWPAG